MSSARIEELRKKFDENPRRYFAPLANEYRKAGDFDQAIFICQEYLPQQPGHMSGHIVFGQALFEAKRLPEAKTVFETALSLDPENLIALRHLADISRDLGDAPAAKGWYERVLQADPRNEEVVAIMEKLGAAAAAAPTAETPAKPAPAEPHRPTARTLPDASGASAPTVELSAKAVQELLKARQGAKAAPPTPATPVAPAAAAAAPPPPPPEPHGFAPLEIEPTTLDATPTVEIRTVESTPAVPAGTMEGLEPTSLGTMDLPTIEPIGLEGNTAPGVQAEPAAAEPAPLDGLDTISLDDIAVPGTPSPAVATAPAPEPAPAPAPAGDGLLDLDSSFTLGGPPAAPAAPTPSAAETPIDGGHPSGDLIDLDFEAAPAPAPAPVAETPSVPTVIMEAVKSVVPAVQDAVESAAPALMDLVDTTIPAVVETVKSTVEAVVETPTVIIEAIKAPSKAEPPAVPPAATPAEPRPSQSIPFVTETMAQLYLSQGHRAEAIDIYRKLIEARPGDAELKARLAAIEAEERAATAPKAAPAPAASAAPAPVEARRFAGTGPSIRVVLRELFGLDGSTSYAAGPAAPGIPAEAGSIDMLFSTESVNEPLSPLAAAFDGGFVAAKGTIDSVFAGGR